MKLILHIAILATAILSCYAGFTYSQFGFGLLAFVCPPLLAWAAAEKSLRSTALVFASFSFFSWALIANWLPFGINSMIPNYSIFGYLTLLTLALLSAFPYAIFGLLIGHFGWLSRRNPHPLAAAAVLCLLVELWPARLPGSLGHALVAQTALTQIVDIGGTGLLSFLVYGCGFLIVKSCLLDATRRSQISSLLILAAIMAGTICYGINRITYWDPSHLESSPITIALIQPNLPLEHLVTPESRNNSLITLGQQTRKIIAQEKLVDLIVWPEIPLYFSPHNKMDDKEFLSHLLMDSPIPLLANADSFDNEIVFGRVPFYNTVQLFRGSGEIEQEYRKMILVPFGEFLPFEEFLPEWILMQLGDLRRYVAGKRSIPIELNQRVKIGTPICLEAHHSELINEMVHQGATILVNPANDAYFGSTMGAYVDLALTIFRAIEFRIPLVRVTNSGISTVIDQRGIPIDNSTMPQFAAESRIVHVSPSAQLRSISPKNCGIIILSIIAIGGLLSKRRSLEMR